MAVELPLFPLTNIAFPGGLLPLRIFETRYVDMVTRSLKNDEGRFGACLIRSGEETGGGGEPFDVGVRVRVVDFNRLEDGFLGIIVRGEQRFRVLERWQQPDRLWVGRVELMPNEPAVVIPDELAGLGDLVRALYDVTGEPYASQARYPDDAGWVGSRLAELLPLDIRLRQELLEMSDPVERLHRLAPLIHVRRKR